MTAAAVRARVETLQADVAAHNAAIRRHRKQRRDSRAALMRLAAECRRLGIDLVLEPQHSEGVVHGDAESES